MQRYFVEGNINAFSFSDNDIFHITKVMRMKENDNIEVVCNQKCYLCKIININPFQIDVIDELKEDRELDIDVTLLYCLPKGEKLDLVIQKATELGVNHIIGVESSRTIVHYENNKIESKLQRFNKIMKEASEQSHRLDIPIITDIMTIKDLEHYNCKNKFICSLTPDSKKISTYINKENKEEMLFVIGPEGGISDNENKILTSYGFKNITLGKRVLRVETAAICIASIINYIYEG